MAILCLPFCLAFATAFHLTATRIRVVTVDSVTNHQTGQQSNNDSAPLYWRAILESQDNQDFFVPPNIVDASSPAGHHVIAEFRRAASMKFCRPLASRGRSLGDFLSGLKTGAMLVDMDVTLDPMKELETAAVQMRIAEHASMVPSGKKTALEIEKSAVHTWWRAMREYGDRPDVLSAGQAWLATTSRSKDPTWAKVFPNHSMAEIALNVLRYRLSHKGKLPARLSLVGADSKDPVYRRPYKYDTWDGGFDIYAGPPTSLSDADLLRGALIFNASDIGRERGVAADLSRFQRTRGHHPRS